MTADLALLRALLTRMARRTGGMQRTLYLGLSEEIVALGFAVASPFLLRRAVERLGHAAPLELAILVTSFVLSWTAPSLIAALKLTRTVTLADGLFRQIADPLLDRQLQAIGGGAGPDTGHVSGVLERLPFSLQWVLDGLIWRAAPLLAQVLIGLVTLALALPLRYAASLGATLLLFLLISDLGAARLTERTAKANLATARLSADLGDVVRNAVRVVCNGTLARELNGLAVGMDDRRGAHQAVARLIAATTTFQSAFLVSGLSVTLFVAGIDVGAHRLDVGDFVLLQAFALRLALPLSSLAITLRQSGTALANIREALHLAAPLKATSSSDQAQPNGALDLVLEDVSFTYPGGGAGLRNISLNLPPNQLVVVAGANGSGKSTLARLMAGLIQPDHGRVFIGGAALADMAADHRPMSILYVPQYIGLFNRPLRDNGLYPPARQSDATLAERLGQWNFHANRRPVDLDAIVGERGARLSGGQVQKLELARLCAVETPILVLDESTSALDAPSEAEIIRTLRARFAGRLLILVTHRPTLAKAADQVVFLEAGRLAGVGRHDALMAGVAYRSLWP